MTPMRLGTARIDITPPIGTRFVGHLNRDRPAESVLDPLAARVLSLSDGTTRVLLVNLDLLELGPSEAGRLARTISGESGVPPRAVIVAATHTHTGPPVIALAGVPVDEQYFDLLCARTARAAAEAVAGESPVTVRAGTSDVRLGVNRRSVVDGRVIMAPNPGGPVDPTLTVVSFDGADGRPRGLLVNYAVHPTTLAVSLHRISADYPGRLLRALYSGLPGVELAYLLGACGDVKAAIYDSAGGFKEGGEEDIDRLGSALAASVLDTLASAGPARGTEIALAEEDFFFPYSRVPSAEELQALETKYLGEVAILAANPAPRGHIDPLAAARYMAEWARVTRGRAAHDGARTGVASRVRLVRIGADVALVGVPGELFSETGLAIRATSPFAATIVAGYVDGSLGYFPTARALAEGGYEASDAYKYYGHPAPFAAVTCDALAAACGAALRRLAGRRAGIPEGKARR
jgi:neutral ceramidase